jgi:tRNA A-37 threonylcarbamoyl transferase component Bud32
LREARKAGVLSGGKLPTAELPNQAAAFARFEKQQALEQELKLVNLVIRDLKLAKYENLAWLVAQRPANGMPLLVLSVRYFFRRQVEGDPALQVEMTFRTLEGLQESQAAGFRSLQNLFAQHGQRLDALFGVVERIAEVTASTQQTAREIKHAVDGQSEHIQRIEQGVMRLLGQMGQRELSPSDSLSIRTDAERAAVKELLASYRSLPEEQRKRLPGLLGQIGKLEIATGHFEEAQRSFDKMATLSQDPRVQAEAHYNAYLAALERRDWPGAFRKLYETLRLDAKRYAPFPINNYKPNRILGAGGFGIVFLCKHAALGDHIVVKALRTDNLDGEADRLFDEAQILLKLNHPGVIRLRDCGYVQVSTKSRPYLVMDYFDGISLEEHVRQHGCLEPDELKAVVLPVAEALQAAHEQNILHRDVKPANILIRKEGDEWQVRLIDFGLALKQSVLQAPSSHVKSDAHSMVEKSIANGQRRVTSEAKLLTRNRCCGHFPQAVS